MWQTPATIPPTCKRVDRKYVSSKGSEFLFSHPAPNSLVVEAASRRSKQHFWSTSSDKESRRLDLFGHNVYFSTLQFWVANYATLLPKYDHKNYGKFMEFTNDIPRKRDKLKSLVSEGQMILRTALQAALDAADTAARSTATAVVVCQALWFSSSSFPWEMQNTVKDLPFDGEKLFCSQNQ